ncbi:stage V sporulation protein B [Clostridium homopropionicum DSM 5847]|uniref:Stage V sporulation protein B n=1 Tax=Clostridium homopropionicum DSM 5847 TaxID=1121318 RepID=A0A0L6ZEJ6_9CLOT|nr:polysaccharide biosynthesis protein [Clostridium homopropionicum]KOA21377.1 stage V sporulation protein B [Clostridium homopropionicum DSM 5847]SFG11871.1 stage V sporulation protein B [Clostridium homopropionicum]
MKEQSTTKGFAILSAAGIIVKLLSLLYIPFLKYIITLNGFGIYQASYKIYVWIYVIANAGIPAAISKLVSEYMALQDYKDAVKSFKIARFMMLIIGTVMSLFMFIFAGPLARLIEYENAKLAIMALAPTIFFTSIVSSYRGYFQGRGNMTPTAVSQILEQIVNTIGTLVFAAMFMKYGVDAGCAGGTLGTSLGSLIAAIYLIIVYEKNKIIRVPKGYTEKNKIRKTNKQLVMRIIQYGVPLVICVGLQYSGDIIDLAIVKRRLLYSGLTDFESNEKFGLFSMYRTLLSVPITLISALAASVLPAISGSYSLKDKESVQSKINYALRFCFLVAVPSAVGLAVLNDGIFELLFKEKQGGVMLLYGSVVLVLNSIVLIQTSILQSIGKLYTSTLFIMLGVFGKIITNYILVGIPSINIIGAIFGNMVFFLIPLILNYNLINRKLKIKIKLFTHFKKPFLASALMGIVVYGLNLSLIIILSKYSISGYVANAIATVIPIFIAIFIYILGLAITGGISQEDLKELPSKFTKLIPKTILKLIK